jgi:hypothetical protein
MVNEVLTGLVNGQKKRGAAPTPKRKWPASPPAVVAIAPFPSLNRTD